MLSTIATNLCEFNRDDIQKFSYVLLQSHKLSEQRKSDEKDVSSCVKETLDAVRVFEIFSNVLVAPKKSNFEDDNERMTHILNEQSSARVCRNQ